jgi:hypothetical protein
MEDSNKMSILEKDQQGAHVCVLLVFLSYVYHDARCRECKFCQCPTGKTNVSIQEHQRKIAQRNISKQEHQRRLHKTNKSKQEHQRRLHKTNKSKQEHQRKIAQNKYIETRTPKKDCTKQIYRNKNTKQRLHRTNI